MHSTALSPEQMVSYALMDLRNQTFLGGGALIFFPYASLCDICWTNFDAIGKMETFSEDLAYIVEAIGLKVKSMACDFAYFCTHSKVVSSTGFNQ